MGGFSVVNLENANFLSPDSESGKRGKLRGRGKRKPVENYFVCFTTKYIQARIVRSLE